MASTHTLTNIDDTKAGLKCAQINLHHARVATATLMKYIADNKVDIICIQEPYIHQGRVVGIDTKYRTFTAGETRKSNSDNNKPKHRRDANITNLRRRHDYNGDNRRQHYIHTSEHAL